MSAYPMTDVGEAIAAVLAEASKIPPKAPERVALLSAGQRVLAEDVVASAPFPPFPAAILDGYAVNSSALLLGNGLLAEYELLDERVTAGADPQSHVFGAQAVYVATGAKLPVGADAVIGTTANLFPLPT